MDELKKVEDTLDKFQEGCKENHQIIADKFEDSLKTNMKIDNRIFNLEEWQKRQNGCLKDIKDNVQNIKEDMHSLKIDTIQGKPTWAVLVIITLLTSTVVGFLVRVL